MSIYDPANWYYFVNGDQSRVFATARAVYVPLNDAAYQAWLADNNQADNITAATLGAVLADVQIRPSDATILDAYQARQANTILSRAAFKILFNHENRLRAVERALNLNGNPPNLTAGQAFNAIKGLL